MSKFLLSYLQREYGRLTELIARETQRQPADEVVTARLNRLKLAVEAQFAQFVSDAAPYGPRQRSDISGCSA